MPSLTAHNRSGINYITAKHPDQPKTHLYRLPSPPPVGPNGNFDVDPETEAVEPELLFTENNTNFSRLYGGQNKTPYVEDAFHDHIIPSHRPPPPEGDEDFSHKIHSRARVYSTAGSEVDDDEVEEGPCTPFPSGPDFVNPNKTGTKSAAHYIFKDVPSQGGCSVARLKLTPLSVKKDLSIEDKGIFDDAVEAHRQEADEFYNPLVFGPISDDFKQIMQGWLEGDPAQPPPPPPERKLIRNQARSLLSCSSTVT
ncbi:MAG: hypothetical protein NXY57DRAFT_1079900 [Lentinula lateritia]|nr:MAG: hypothetical protein NXY57DRAFT_1079900 [Lentinula lateritia]